MALREFVRVVLFTLIVFVTQFSKITIASENQNSASLTPVPEVVLIVGENHFLRYELEAAISSFVPAAGFHGGITQKQRSKYTDQALELLIDRALLYLAAQNDGIDVDPGEVAKIVEKNIERFDSEKAFLMDLERRGITLSRFKEMVVQENAVTQYVNTNLAPKAVYSETELRTYYNEHPLEFQQPESVGLWHIIIKVAPNATGDARMEKRKLAESVASRARKKEDFTDLARVYSEDEYRVKGGWIGYIHKGRLLPELEKEAFGLKKNSIAGPIASLQGYHIIKIGDRRPAEKIPFKDAQSGLRKRLEQDRFDTIKKKILNELRNEVKVKVLLKDLHVSSGTDR